MASPPVDVLLLPDLIVDEIMMIVGIKSEYDLHRCRLVCSKWDEKIRRILKDKNKKLLIQAGNWGPNNLPTEEEISQVKRLGKSEKKLSKLLVKIHIIF